MAISDLASDLNSQIIESSPPLDKLRSKTIVFDPFVDSKNAQELDINAEIMHLMSPSFATNIKLVPLTVDNLGKADMVLTGILSLEDNASGAKGKAYRIFASVLTLRTGLARARSCAWSESIDLKPLPIYDGNPVYLRDVYLRNQEAAARAANPRNAHARYINHLETRAMLFHAYRTFEGGDYQGTLDELDRIAERPDGPNMATYSAMYMTCVAMNDLEAARQPLANLFRLGVEDEKALDVKFLFDVNSDRFIQKSPRQAKEYALWLQEIARIVEDSGICLQIIGHCSRTGEAAYNDTLSLKRAKTVLRAMVAHYRDLGKKSTVLGRGFRENVVGSGTDDIQDMIDRRVEFKVIPDCGNR